MTAPDPDSPVTLSPADAAALDALVAASFDPSGVEPALRERAARIARVLTPLGAPLSDPVSDALADATLARILRLRHAEPALLPDDEDALESLLTAGLEVACTPSPLRARAARHRAVADLVTGEGRITVPVGLAERTWDRVERESARDAAPIPFERAAHRAPARLADLVSVAALLLIGVSVLWPVLASARQYGRKVACNSRLGSVADAMGAYAGANRDVLPVAAAAFGGPWWNVGSRETLSNSANLYTLKRTGYSTLESLACPGNTHAPTVCCDPEDRDWRSFEEVSFSYQIMAGPSRTTWRVSPDAVVLADRSPVVIRAKRGEVIDPCENSPNHAGQGQFVLFADGSVRWLSSPERESGDNIWLPRPLEQLIRTLEGRPRLEPIRGTEAPADPADAFVGP